MRKRYFQDGVSGLLARYGTNSTKSTVNDEYFDYFKNLFEKFDTKIKDITKKDKDMNDIKVHIKYLSAQSKQCLISRMYANIKTLHTLKSKGLQKCGKLKYSKEETIIDLKQYGVSHKIISSKRIKIVGLPKTFIVNGLEQFINIPNIEFANARLIHRGNGYHVQFVCYIPKESESDKIHEIIGVDTKRIYAKSRELASQLWEAINKI